AGQGSQTLLARLLQFLLGRAIAAHTAEHGGGAYGQMRPAQWPRTAQTLANQQQTAADGQPLPGCGDIVGGWFDQITNGAVHGGCLPQLLRRRAEISSCLRMVERPRMFCARAFFISCSLVWSARDAERDPLLRVAAACLAESLRSADLACDDFF